MANLAVDTTDARTGAASPGKRAGGGVDRTLPVSIQTDDCYKMNHRDRGRAIIFNNKIFTPSSRMNKRDGSDVDAQHLFNLFNNMDFKADLKTDQKADDMISAIEKVARDNHANEDCLVVVILSHGEEGDRIWGTDKAFPLDRLVEPLRQCKTLAGKPKLFFIQACRGMKLDVGQEVCDALPEEDEEEMEVGDPLVYKIPTNADFLFAYSTVPGYYAWRNQERGSWFIQAICEVFRDNWQRMEILNMMTRVAKKVAYDFESNCAGYMGEKKQVPCLTSMLTRDLYFTPKKS